MTTQPAEQGFREMRHEPRVRSFLRGEILHSGGSMKADCTIRDISEEGARLEVPTSFTLPENFELYVPARNQRFKAITVWRHAREIGVKFKIETNRDGEAPAMRSSTDMARRVQDLEDEVTKLRRQLGQMRAVVERFTGESV